MATKVKTEMGFARGHEYKVLPQHCERTTKEEFAGFSLREW